MPSTYTTSLRLTLPATGDLVGTWGNTVNSGVTSLVDQAIAGTVTITMSPDTTYTLTSTNGAADQARNMFINVTGGPHSGTTNVICPSVSKMYVVTNNTAGGQGILFKTAAGNGPVVSYGIRAILYCDGTNVSLLGTWGVSGNPVLIGDTTITGNTFVGGSLGVNTGSLISSVTVNGDIAFSTTGQKLFHYYFGPTNYAATTTTGGGDITWYTGVGSVAERMRLDSAGNLSVGTTSAGGYKLALSGGSKTLWQTTDNTNAISYTDGGYYLGTTGATDLVLVTNNAVRMSINSAGETGIGTSPVSGSTLTVSSTFGVVGNGTAQQLIYNANAANGNASQLVLWNDTGFSSTSGNIGYRSSGSVGNLSNELFIAQNGNADLTLYRNGSEYIRLTGDGYGNKVLVTSADINTFNGVTTLGGGLFNTYAYNNATSGTSKLLCVQSDGKFTNAVNAVVSSAGDIGIGAAPFGGTPLLVAKQQIIYNTSTTPGDAAALLLWNDNGFSSTSGAIGYRSSASVGSQANELFVAQNAANDLTLYRNGTDYIRLTAAYGFDVLLTNPDINNFGGVLVNTYAYSATASGSAKLLCVEPDGTFTNGGTSTRRIKTNIQSISDASFIMALNPVTYQRKKKINGVYVDTPMSEQREYGFIAEEVAEVDPRLASYEKVRDENGNVVIQPDGLNPLQFIAPAIKFVQQLKHEIDALRAELNALKGVN